MSDTLTPKQYGENAHIEYTWSNNLKERIVQFFYQCNRCESTRVAQLSNILKELLTSIGIDKPYHLNILYRIIGHTRDIVNGKGEYTLSYMMINVWYDFYPELAKHALSCFVKLEDTIIHPYGSWKDIKYFCQYCLDSGRDIRHPLILYALSLLNTQLKTDLDTTDDKISLVAKWIPREDSKFGQFYEILAVDYFNEITLTAYDNFTRKKAILKCKTNYRKIISGLNKKLKTVQINQCDNTWAQINFNNVTSVTLAKNRKAFLNKKIGGETKYPDNKDRTKCTDNLNTYIENRVENGLDIKGKCIGFELFTSTAIDLIHREKMGNDNNIQTEIDLLNLQWKNNSGQTDVLNNCIALVDVSRSMQGAPSCVANAIGIRISEKSKLGKRIMIFDNKPKWINLEKCDDFFSMTKLIFRDVGSNANFYAALELILDAIIETKLKPEEVSDLTLVILSDMQMSCTVHNNSQTVYETIEQKYKEAGIKLYNKPFNTPHIVFWNLRSTDGFPVLSKQKNTSMISGFNPALLNTFCKEGTSTFRFSTPFNNLEKIVMNKRYDYLGYKISTNI